MATRHLLEVTGWDEELTRSFSHLLDLPVAEIDESGSVGSLNPDNQMMQPSSSLHPLEYWDRRQRHSETLPEYESAAKSIIISPELMCDSSLSRSLRRLRDERTVWPPVGPFNNVVRRLVRKAWHEEFGGSGLLMGFIRGAGSVESFMASVPGVSEGNMYGGAMRLYDDLGWERPYLHEALECLMGREEPEGLRIVAAMMLRGSMECRARKRYVFCSIVNRLNAESSSEPHDGGDGDDIGSPNESCQYLREQVLSPYLDEVKLRALHSTFLEPTKMYYRAIGDHTAEGDVDVHGANVYLAVLGSTLGVAFDRTPLSNDGVKAVADVAAAGMDGLLGSRNGEEDGCWNQNRLGVSWESIPSCRSPRVRRRVPSHQFIFVPPGGRRMTAMDVANAAIDPSPSEALSRAQLAPYLEQFASYFAKPFILQRMFSHLTGGGAGPKAERALDVVYKELRVAMLGPGQNDGDSWLPEDVRHFCWDLDNGDTPSFREENGLMLFAFIGICTYEADGEDGENYLHVDECATGSVVLGTDNSVADAYLDVD